MRAVVHDRYGPPEVLRLEEVERPVPKDDEVLVRVHATTVNRTGLRLSQRRAFISRFFTGLLRPKRRILGMELAGEVEAVGAAVTEFEVGDRRLRRRRFGAHAEFVCVREERRARAHAGGHDVRGGGGGLRRSAHRARMPAEGAICARAGASSSTAPPDPSERRRCSSPSTSAPTSRRCATRRTSSSCARSEPTRSSTTCRRTSRRTARRTTSSSTRSASTRSGAARRSLKPGGIFVETDLGFMWHVPLLALLTRWIGDKKRDARDHEVHEGGRPLPQGARSRPGSTGRSSTGAIRWRTSSRRRSTSRPGRRPATSS